MDLGGFKYKGVTSETFEFVAELLNKGVNVSDVYKKVLSLGFDAVQSFGKRRGELLSKGKWTTYLRELLLKIGLNSKLLYDYPKTVKYFFSPRRLSIALNVSSSICAQRSRSV